jgi:response regulator NasT
VPLQQKAAAARAVPGAWAGRRAGRRHWREVAARGGVAPRLPQGGGVGDVARWRVVILDDDERSRAELRAAVWAARGAVVGEARRCADALEVVERTRPDVGVFAAGLGDGDGIEMAGRVADAPGCPVVLFAGESDEGLVARARHAGVMAYLLKPLRPAALAPTLDLAIARFREARDLRQRLEDRKVIERAKGVVMERAGLTEDAAYRSLRRAAMDSRRPLVDIARELLGSAPLLATFAVGGDGAAPRTTARPGAR